MILYALRPSDTGHRVLLLKRTQTLAGEWCQISGRMDEGEKPWQTALRELHEETGLKAQSLYTANMCETYYGATLNMINIAPVFVAYIDPTADVRLNFEHSEFKWASFDEAVEMVPYGGQRRMLRHIEVDFSKRVPNRYLKINTTG